ncbi:MAG: triose-phosphate isomerase [Bacteroidales bacterium]
MRKKVVAGNWKMKTNLQDGLKLIEEIKSDYVKIPDNVSVIIAPPFTHLYEIFKLLNGTGIKVAAQNCSKEESGAYTGEVSASMIRSTGAEYVIIGHSERRSYFNEDDDDILKKNNVATKNELFPIVCCGESLEDREKEQHFDVVKKQLENTVFKLDTDDFSKIMIAYEPVWAIGTGRTATPEQAQEMHNFIRKLIDNQFPGGPALQKEILYGGSCKPSNAKELFGQPDIDGGLIGGASLKAKDFIEICRSYT